MVSIIGIIGTFPIVIVFSISFILMLRSHLRNPNRAKIFFMIWAIFTILIYLTWGIRVLIIPQFESNTKTLYPYWALAYAFGGSSMVALDIATIEMSRLRDSPYKKYIMIIILATLVSFLIILSIGFEVALTIFMDVSDLTITNINIYVYFTILIFFYLFFPNAILFNYLIKSPERNTFTYKRVIILELGILLFSVGTTLDGMRLPSNIGILVARIILLIGGLIIVRGLLMKPVEK